MKHDKWKGPIEDQGDEISMDLRGFAHRLRRAIRGRGKERPRPGLEEVTEAAAEIFQALGEATPEERRELCDLLEREADDEQA